MNQPLLALTVHQPWAWGIVSGIKPVENRSWEPSSRMIGQRIAIHASKTYDLDGAKWMVSKGLVKPLFPQAAHVRGSIVGLATLDHVTSLRFGEPAPSPWFVGPIGWWWRDPVMLPTPIDCRGALGLWAVPSDLAALVMQQIEAA